MSLRFKKAPTPSGSLTCLSLVNQHTKRRTYKQIFFIRVPFLPLPLWGIGLRWGFHPHHNLKLDKYIKELCLLKLSHAIAVWTLLLSFWWKIHSLYFEDLQLICGGVNPFSRKTQLW